jgi:transcription factor SFP1
LLANGQHECLQHAHGKSAHSSRHSTPGRGSGNGSSTTPAAQQQHQHQLQLQNQQQYQQPPQMNYSSPAQPQQFIHSQHSPSSQAQPRQFGNTMTAPMAMPSAGMYMSRDAYMS